MPRAARNVVTHQLYHLSNHVSGGRPIFEHAADFRLGEHLLVRAKQGHDLMVHAFVLLPHRWHVIAAERERGALSRFVATFTRAHSNVLRERRSLAAAGGGTVYADRFRSHAVTGPTETLKAIRYVERAPMAERLVVSAEHWEHSSLHHRLFQTQIGQDLLDPIPLPPDWPAIVCAPIEEREIRELAKQLDGRKPIAYPVIRKIGSDDPQGPPAAPMLVG
jgi:REP element-mobilizing transposase RayT